MESIDEIGQSRSQYEEGTFMLELAHAAASHIGKFLLDRVPGSECTRVSDFGGVLRARARAVCNQFWEKERR